MSVIEKKLEDTQGINFYLPILSPVRPPPGKMNGSSEPRFGPVLQCVDDLEIDKETTDEGKTKLCPHGDKTKANAEATAPIFRTQLHSVIVIPLKVEFVIQNSNKLEFPPSCERNKG